MPEKFEPGVPLDHYRQHDASIQLHCTACAQMTLLDLETVIAGLIARRLGDERTGIRALARTFRRPCERCGATAWETRPCFPSQKPSMRIGGPR
ncbi:hypothetical protein [Caulobacter sp. BP25]|uniref:hypothetical protein n=1 Tax=Caulobacter sp. BP25 TaxID=2048900 RepID=UPI000C12CB78|nr:hypothetical protein [Caulobacter sp. BP25]PHY20949.1 hypothetical protein CSW59_06995 [Caulobacter sp. BP25]